MKRASLVALACFAVLTPSAPAQNKESKKVAPVLNFKVANIDGKTVNLADYQGKVVLIVNVASECGYTGQYKGLQELHAKYAKDGLAILGFPCNDFGAQEPGTEKQIAEFCTKNYAVKFDLFGKVKIAGKDAHPLFQFLTSKDTNPRQAGAVKWNFEKFLIGRDGTILARFAADAAPESADFQKAIRTALGQ